MSDELADLAGRAIPTKKRADIRATMAFIRSKDGAQLLADKVWKEILAFTSYQAPEKIHKVFRLIRIDDIFSAVAQRRQGVNRSRDVITKEMNNYTKGTFLSCRFINFLILPQEKSPFYPHVYALPGQLFAPLQTAGI